MRNRPARIALLSLALLAPLFAKESGPRSQAPQPAAVEDGIGVWFSPGGGALAALVDQINAAKRSIDVQAYLMTTKELISPLAKASQRGVRVRVIMDAKNAGDKYSASTYLVDNKVPVWLDSEHKEAHNKVMIFDSSVIATGSFNFTRAADEENAENLLILSGKPKLVKAYEANFEKHLAHAKPATK